MSMTLRNCGWISCTKYCLLLISLEALTYSKQFRWKKTTLHCLHDKKRMEHLWDGLIKVQNGVNLWLTSIPRVHPMILGWFLGFYDFGLFYSLKGCESLLQGMQRSYILSSQSWPAATERMIFIIQLHYQKQNKEWSCFTFNLYIFACLK